MKYIFFSLVLLYSGCTNVDVLDRIESAKNQSFGWHILALGPTAPGNFLSPGVQFSATSAPCTNLSGITKANCICGAEIANLPVKGTYRAWLSISGSVDAICNVIGKDGTSCEVPDSVGPFTTYRSSTSGFRPVIIAETYSELSSTGVSQTVSDGGSGIAWTGNTASGKASGSDCSGFTSTSGSGTIGNQGSTGTLWTSSVTNSCSSSFTFYCVRQGN